MNIYEKAGKMALGSRLRRLGELFAEQSAQIYPAYGIEIQPKWFPVYYALSNGGEKSITEIAVEIGHSHPSVSTIVKEMMKKGLVVSATVKGDGRKNFVKLSEIGLSINEKIEVQYADVNAAVESAFAETQYNLWKAIEEWEFLLEQKSLVKRVEEQRKLRESKDVEIVPYQPEHKHAFKQLNVDWITQYFKMEDFDYKYLDHPQENILNKGGYIFMAIYKNEPVGTCAIVKMDDATYELAKMGVAPHAKGKGIGYLLGCACADKAKRLGATKLYLESNTLLKPAISLYQKLGFKKIAGPPSPYERSNIQMELEL
ncbi:bifunctional helix-turn-helix transcriptional regulator/GNAT family N-acetyltransferase [Mucilaginibacter sp. L3T2-6]|uniref:bifunctional helix-turn-helix transcriptional regulator/GNAT family N-acetyltransferase n=1 Tax=Mucilaginibacter sp. L3T2-6 TaxID=3062491 RepID=UPI002675DC60|nr:bifunctional helix-turn-helix transcriptional regulator/GNAT family N-acetyltransferase [Mucilaginibacter sp. L3T2-6]MDO3641012.1 bifunctional helix-turn-helix transcriptional regulator/GNAT family N-acetyltransferase [Mucilaginibacter sp. L3T2-6]MDV6213512.1 bifunctional helix-turn-helix transcriptional regulator/GNAT family N-acetyltransferase [Mucilaginibacter sp. L3T2-6]